jgi:hypothetical protein
VLRCRDSVRVGAVVHRVAREGHVRPPRAVAGKQ